MKKTHLILGILSALILASCASPAGSSNDDPAVTGATNGNTNTNTNTGKSNVNYKLTIDSNIPTSPYNGYYVHSSYTNYKNEMAGSTITLPQSSSNYDYSKDSNSYSYSVAKTFKCSCYNTKADGTGTSYNFGDKITLTKDTILYCQYSLTNDYEAEKNAGEEAGNTGTESGSTKTLSEKLVGTWKCNGSSYTGTLTLYSNGTGNVNIILAGKTAHDSTLSWTIYSQTYNSKNYLKISGVNDGGKIDGSHEIKSVTASSFTIDGKFGFGMPDITVWYKQ